MIIETKLCSALPAKVNEWRKSSSLGEDLGAVLSFQIYPVIIESYFFVEGRLEDLWECNYEFLILIWLCLSKSIGYFK